ncbi:Glycosyltransferase involved in cell wall bisynthesis [Alkalispirochaeta americana]|uniref:Glycosyltransferase involved in cell wall bisynthesis n=1 Tax=Alkalispirochaeta americana TaxID=159291 RepID=A0A1N6RVE1_9SPIO|nr:glycosyltransferase [Alkalispirochaeta americana]SIQ32692.1 Glycosyltransferase involved in cell wall bisynthesis [Alkalispirochaeta americana]
MRVCHLTTRLVKGGADFNIFYNMLRGAPDLVQTLVVGAEYHEGMVEELRQAGVEVVVVPHICREISPGAEVRAFRWLWRFFRKNSFDIVYTHNAKTGILGRFAVPRRAGGAVVLHGVHGMSFTDSMARPVFLLFRWLERRAAGRTDLFVSVGYTLRDLMVEAGVGRPGQYRIIRSGMEIERFRLARRDEALRQEVGCSGPDDVLCAVVARLEQRKGQHWFLEAFARAVEELERSGQGLSLRAVLLGDGPRREALEEQARRLGVSSRVVFPGFRDNPQDYFAAADLVCLTSEWEGVPQSLVQAAAAGRAAVAFDVPGIRETVEEGVTGLVVPFRDISALTEALVHLARDRELRERFGRAAAARPLEEWSLPVMVERTDALYRQVLAPGSGARFRRGVPEQIGPQKTG